MDGGSDSTLETAGPRPDSSSWPLGRTRCATELFPHARIEDEELLLQPPDTPVEVPLLVNSVSLAEDSIMDHSHR